MFCFSHPASIDVYKRQLPIITFCWLPPDRFPISCSWDGVLVSIISIYCRVISSSLSASTHMPFIKPVSYTHLDVYKRQVPLELGIFLNPVRICFIGPVLRKGQGHESHVPLVEILLGHALSLVQVIEALHVFNGIQDMGVCKGQLLLIPIIKPSPAGVNRISPAVIIGSELVQQSVSVYILCYLTACLLYTSISYSLAGDALIICNFSQ